MPTCHCESAVYTAQTAGCSATRDASRSAATLGLSCLVAFFPKCPMCWAAYTSWLGVAGFLQASSMRYLYPVLVVLLGLHLLLLWKQASRVGYGPLMTSISGALTLLLVRHYAADVPWALNAGILLMFGGSVWNSMAMRKVRGTTMLSGTLENLQREADGGHVKE